MSKKWWGCLIWAWVAGVSAQPASYPNKPIRMVVPYAAGGNADITARMVARKMSEGLGQPIVIENKGGANGGIGTDMVAKAAPDGYTLLMVASGPIVINPVLYDKVPYDPVRDLQPVSQVLTYQYTLVTPAKSAWMKVDDLIAQAIGKLKSYGVAMSGEAETMGLGAMTDARWEEFFGTMSKEGVYPADLDYRAAYTLAFVNKGVGLEAKTPPAPPAP